MHNIGNMNRFYRIISSCCFSLDFFSLLFVVNVVPVVFVVVVVVVVVGVSFCCEFEFFDRLVKWANNCITRRTNSFSIGSKLAQIEIKLATER